MNDLKLPGLSDDRRRVLPGGFAVLNIEPAVARQALHGLAQGRAGDPDLGCEVALAGQAAVDRKSTVQDGFEQAAFGNLGWFGHRFPTHGRSSIKKTYW